VEVTIEADIRRRQVAELQRLEVRRIEVAGREVEYHAWRIDMKEYTSERTS
jgi:hypothetical protein